MLLRSWLFAEAYEDLLFEPVLIECSMFGVFRWHLALFELQLCRF